MNVLPEATHARMWIGADCCDAAGGARYEVFNPATGEQVGTAPLAGAAEAARAIECASRALPAWRDLTVERRAAVIVEAVDAVERQADALARLLTREQGKPVDEALTEISGFTHRLRAVARLALGRADGCVPMLPSASAGTFGALRAASPRVTVGLVAWNFPVGLVAKKIGPVLMAGGTVVLKPASTAPLTAALVVDLMVRAGVPAGVINLVTGKGDEVGAALAAHPLVQQVHLTGNGLTADAVRNAARANGSEVLLELEGSDPMIVCADADLTTAVHSAVAGRFRNAGQVCRAVKRLYVATELYDEFVTELCRLTRLREPGNGLDRARPPLVRMGPLHTAANRDRVHAQLRDAVGKGATVLLGGNQPRDAQCANGHFFEPTIVADVPAACSLVREEVFGPVLPVFRTDDIDHAIAQANDSPWGLSATVWTRNQAMARLATSRLRCRQVWVNRLPFGLETPGRRGQSAAADTGSAAE